MGEAIAWATHHVYENADADAIAAWLWRLDMRIYEEIIEPRTGKEIYERAPEEYKTEESERILLLPVPYDELYHAYLAYQLYRLLDEDGKAGDAAAAYNLQLDAYRAAVIRRYPGRRLRFRY